MYDMMKDEWSLFEFPRLSRVLERVSKEVLKDSDLKDVWLRPGLPWM